MQTCVLLLSIAVLSAGCTANLRRAASLSPASVVPAHHVDDTHTADLAAPDPAPLDPTTFVAPDDPEIQAALKEFEEKGTAPIIKRDDFVRFPYGASEPVLECKPLHACDVELQAGEDILGIGLGDAERWDVDFTFSGHPDYPTPHLILKAKYHNIATNVIVTTSRRTYHIKLVSTRRRKLRQLKFYYPHDQLSGVNDRLRAEQTQRQQRHAHTVARFPSLSVETLNFQYTVEGADGFPTWTPLRAFDDGKHVYIQMPPDLHAGEAPALLVNTASGDALVNYRIRGDYYVVDKLFNQAVLINGTGKHQERVLITRLGSSR